MDQPVSKEFVFQCGHVFNKNRIGFVTNHAATTAQGAPNSQLYILRDGKDWGFTVMKWDAVAISATLKPIPAILVLGRDGEVLIGDAQGYREERINESGISPSGLGPLRSMRTIADSIFAVGMARQVYRRLGDKTWSRCEAGLPAEISLHEVSGFNSVDGFSVDDLYAVGWRGEIWHFDGKLWRQEMNSVHQTLFDVRVVSPSIVYACGENGALLKGNKGKWTALDFRGPRPAFRSMAWFHEKLFLADGHALYVLDKGALSEVDFGVGATVPSAHVHSNDGVLLSVAGKEVFLTSDGITWTALPI